MGQLNFLYETNLETSIKMYQFYEPFALKLNPDGYYLTFSGGKDSIVNYDLAKRSGVKFKAHYNLGFDPPELVYFIKSEYPEVIIHKSQESIWDMIVRKKMPPTRKHRYCCSEFKEKGGVGSFVTTGVRRAESRSRSQRGVAEILGSKEPKKRIFSFDNAEERREIENCIITGKRVLNPIINFSDDDIWNYIDEHKLSYCSLYDEGFKRLGCIGCPKASIKQREKEFERWPMYKLNFIKAFDRMLKAREKLGYIDNWKTGEDVFDWWMYGNRTSYMDIHDDNHILDLFNDFNNF